MNCLRSALVLMGALLTAACSSLPTPGPVLAEAHGDSVSGSSHTRTRNAATGLGAGLQTLSVKPAPEAAQTTVAALETPRDLWERMRRGFAMPDLDTALVRERETWYAQRPEYFERMTARGSKYLFHIVEELERRGLPLELALLPFIESAFNPQAVSHAKAAGMWQFMPATGRHFDLKQNTFRDDRRDVLASTRAALDYLERLHRMFGDWHLALAAYNWGEGNVMRAVKRNQAAGLGTAYTDLRMPDETRHYVPKLQAVKNIVASPSRFAVGLPVVGNHPFFDSVPLDRDIDVALVAKLADVSEKDLRQLNPSHDKPVIMAAGTPTILLPWDNALLFQDRLRLHRGPTATWTAWRVPDTMSATAAARQHGMTEAELREVNRIPPRMVLKAGSTVLVPRQGKLDKDVTEHMADNGQLLLAPESSGQHQVRVKARAGDTLASLAKRHKVSVTQLRQWNQLEAQAKLRPGQTVVLVRSKAAAPTRVAKAGASRKTAQATQAKAKMKAQAKTPAKPTTVASKGGPKVR